MIKLKQLLIGGERQLKRLLLAAFFLATPALAMAQAADTMAGLKTAVGHAIGIAILLGYVYAVILIIGAAIQERGDGSWKYSLGRAVAIFASVGIANILFNIFFPGQNIVAAFA